jgi:hypothetical protein
MKLLFASTFIVALLAPAVGSAQSPRPARDGGDREISVGEIAPTQEMWFYQQELKRHQDPKQAIRRRAEYRAAQRERRLASQEWFGISPLRPNANHTPSMGGMYSPGWAGNSRDPFRWMPQTPTIVIPTAQNFQGIYSIR